MDKFPHKPKKDVSKKKPVDSSSSEELNIVPQGFIPDKTNISYNRAHVPLYHFTSDELPVVFQDDKSTTQPPTLPESASTTPAEKPKITLPSNLPSVPPSVPPSTPPSVPPIPSHPIFIRYITQQSPTHPPSLPIRPAPIVPNQPAIPNASPLQHPIILNNHLQKGIIPPSDLDARKDMPVGSTQEQDDLEVLRHLQYKDTMPSQIGRYEIMNLLGSGGMGQVYRAYDVRLKRAVAIKILNRKMNVAAQRKRLIKEARAAARIQHPNIVSVYEVGTYQGIDYLVMEFLSGVTLENHLRCANPDYTWTLEFMYKTAMAIHYAHRQGIVHRDLKPANIMLMDPDGQPKIMDFGLAKDIGEEPSASTQNKMIGTIFYMAPEQVQAERTVDKRCDIFALGVILYQMLTGQLPFFDDTIVKIAIKIIQQPPKPIHHIVPDIPPEVAAICMKCLEKKAEDRYPSAFALAKDIQSFLYNEKAVTTWTRGYKIQFGIIGIILAVLLIWNIFYQPLSHQESLPTTPIPGVIQLSTQLPSAAKTLPTDRLWIRLETTQSIIDFQNETKVVLQQYPDDAAVFCELGRLFTVLGMYHSEDPLLDQALAYFDKAIALGREHNYSDYQSAFYAYQLCYLYPHLQNRKELYAPILQAHPFFADFLALEEYYDVIKFEAGRANVPGATNYRFQTYENGIQAVAKILERDERSFIAKFWAGKFYYAFKYYSLSQRSMFDAIQFYQQDFLHFNMPPDMFDWKAGCPLYYEMLLIHAINSAEMGQPQIALRFYELALRYTPHNAMANFLLGEHLLKQDKPAMAIEFLTKGINYGYTKKNIYTSRGVAYAQCQKYHEALQDFNKALELSPDGIQDADLLMSRGLIYKYLGQDNEALNDFTSSLQLEPDNRYINDIRSKHIRDMQEKETAKKNKQNKP